MSTSIPETCSTWISRSWGGYPRAEAGVHTAGVGPGRVSGSGTPTSTSAVDDHSRLAYSEVLADERAVTVVAFWRHALAWFADRGVTAQAVLTDNGSAYRSADFARACPRRRHPPPPHAPLPAPDQRQGRALQPHAARGMGLRFASTAPSRHARPRSRAGCTTTITTAVTPPSAVYLRSAVSTNLPGQYS